MRQLHIILLFTILSFPQCLKAIEISDPRIVFFAKEVEHAYLEKDHQKLMKQISPDFIYKNIFIRGPVIKKQQLTFEQYKNGTKHMFSLGLIIRKYQIQILEVSPTI